MVQVRVYSDIAQKWNGNRGQCGNRSCSRPIQLQTVASETVNPIDWPLPPTLYRTVSSEGHFQRGKARHKSVYLGRKPTPLHPAHEATALHIAGRSGYDWHEGSDRECEGLSVR